MICLRAQQRIGGVCPSRTISIRKPCRLQAAGNEDKQSTQPKFIKEYKAWGVRVIESDEALPPPPDTTEPDMWEGENMEKLGSFVEKFFLPVLVVLGLVIGGVAAGTYNEGAEVFQTPASPNALPSLVPADQVLKQ